MKFETSVTSASFHLSCRSCNDVMASSIPVSNEGANQ